MAEYLLEMKQIVKQFPGTLALDHVDFTLEHRALHHRGKWSWQKYADECSDGNASAGLWRDGFEGTDNHKPVAL